MWTSAVQGESSPATFYERYGFKRTGDSHGNEILLRLEISQHQRDRRATSLNSSVKPPLPGPALVPRTELPLVLH